MDYIAILHQEGDSDFGVSFPDFPGCVTAGTTLNEAKNLAKEALVEHIQILREMDEPIPVPSSLDSIKQKREHKDGLAFLVEIPSQKAVRVNVTIPEDTLVLVDRRAEKMKMSRSAFLVYAAIQYKENARKR
jgi:predicted RNase H-like HicB family nuclease